MVNLKEYAGKWLMVTYSYGRGIGMEGLRETVKNLRQLIWHLGSSEHVRHSTAMFGISQRHSTLFSRLDC